MQIREGAYYRTRSGDVVGPMAIVSGHNDIFTATDFTWNEDGSFVRGNSHKLDLISEVYVSDTPPSDAPETVRFNPTAELKLGRYNGSLVEVLNTPPAHDRKTLRDEFAMAMMDADDFMVGFKEHAEQLYRAADAMMEARKK
jgi:hypothetical protein